MDGNIISNTKPESASEKKSGVAVIKEEYIIENHERTLSLDHVAEKDKQKLAEGNNEDESPQPHKKRRLNKSEIRKLKGQNKSRPAPFKRDRESNLCLALVDVLESEDEPKCENPKCSFMHDIPKYMASKLPDIGPLCHIYSTQGRCVRGASCRFGSMHLTPTGRNIVNDELYAKFKLKEPYRNILDKGLQHRLRKHTYDFSKTESTIAKYDERKKLNKTKQENKLKEDETKSKIVSDNEIKESKEVKTLEEDDKIMAEPVLEESKEVKIESGQGDANGKVEEDLKRDSKAGMIKTCGAVTDEDIIKYRKVEKKEVDWKNKLYLSPLTTVGNLPFRRICKGFGADITCGEMAMASALLNGTPQEWALVKRYETEDFFGVQLCGNNPYVMTRCAQLIEENTQIDFIDVNLGCPIELVYQQGSGSGLLRRERALESIVTCMSDLVNIPLTVKTRTGVYTDKNIAHNFVPKFRDWGASLITVHGRSREQRYTKSADWGYIEQCAQLAAPCPVYGNGDILSYEDYENAFVNSPSISGVMIGRGALIKPWIFTEIKERRHWDISSSERLDILKKYVNNGLEHWGSDTKGVESTRRFLLEWLSFLHRYIPVGILEHPPQKINQRPPYFRGRDDLETLMASPSCADWVRISEMLLGPVPENFNFLPKHKANSWK